MQKKNVFYKKNYTFHKRKVWIVFLLCMTMTVGLIGRLVYLMGFRSDYYYEKAEDLHERERTSKLQEEKSWMRPEKYLRRTKLYVRSR